MPKINCLIVDDEPLARKLVQGHIEKLPDWRIAGICKNAVEAYGYLMKERIDVLFLDINMPVISGLDFFRSLTDPPALVFTTAYPEHAVEGFELNALDYLVKPITFKRFLRTVDRVNRYKAFPPPVPEARDAAPADFVFIRHFSKLVKVCFKDILYLEAKKDFVQFVTRQEKLTAAMSMKEAVEQLPETGFIRVHRSYIVSVNAITALFGNTIEIEAVQIPIGGSYKEEVMGKIHGKG